MNNVNDSNKMPCKVVMLKDVLYWEMVFDKELNHYENLIDSKIQLLTKMEQIEMSQLSKKQVDAQKLLKTEIQLLVGFLSIMENLKESYVMVAFNNANLLWKYWIENQEQVKIIEQQGNENEFWLKYCHKILNDNKGGVKT